MLYVLEDAINGILIGSIYGLTAMGLTVIFGVLKVINFAHGSLLMVGMYAAYWAVALTGVHPYLSLIVVAPVMYCFGYYLQDLIIKPIFKAEKDVREPITVIIVTTGVWYVLDNLSLLIFGPQYRTLQDNPARQDARIWRHDAIGTQALGLRHGPRDGGGDLLVFPENPPGAGNPCHQPRPGSGQSDGHQPVPHL